MKSTVIKKTVGMLALCALGWAAATAHAEGYRAPAEGRAACRQTPAYVHQFRSRQARQAVRIRSGWHDGRLSRPQFRSLMHEQRRIGAMERHYAADGCIDRHEFRRLQRMQDAAGRHVRIENHERRMR